jgi:ATP-dependent DNA helicase DinG
VGASPIDVSSVLRELIFTSVDAAVLTSATLTVDGKFDFTRERLGLDGELEVRELVVESPFEYDRQAALYLPAHAPDPRHPGYRRQLAKIIAETTAVTRGGALALFTNTHDMRQVATLLRADRSHEGQIRLQGEAPRHALLDELRAATEPMILLATSSFWEGVDVPGDALRLVIIARLPFASPGDPIVAARLRQLEEAGRSPFKDYQVPLASLALKQGFGRLIRTRHDEGVVALLDRRAWTMGYGKIFLRSLPPCSILRTREELLDWWGDLEDLL